MENSEINFRHFPVIGIIQNVYKNYLSITLLSIKSFAIKSEPYTIAPNDYCRYYIENENNIVQSAGETDSTRAVDGDRLDI